MRFLVVTNAPTLIRDNNFVAYAPYVKELNIWSKYVSDLIILSPTKYSQNLLTASFSKLPEVVSVSSLRFNSLLSSIISSIYMIKTIFLLCLEMKKADHIHLRCPGNIGLLGCFVQIFFPKKIKTAKYAGNWNPKAKQPISYKLQKWILSNTFLTRNMTVLVYGEWENQSRNIKPFFTATFNDLDKEKPEERDYNSSLHFVFIGSLVKGKRPELSIKIVEALNQKGYNVSLRLFGDGVLKEDLKDYIQTKNLTAKIKIEGNQPIESIKKALKTSHFLILPSISEGWPKAVAEAMFFGVIPIATKISCVPSMLDKGNRGILITPEVNEAVSEIEEALKHKDLKRMSKLASDWSQTFTLEYFESEIKKILNH